jgi:hypothetical protein
VNDAFERYSSMAWNEDGMKMFVIEIVTSVASVNSIIERRIRDVGHTSK